MNVGRRVKMVAVTLTLIALVTLMFANFAVAPTNPGTGKFQSKVFAKVYGYGEWINLGIFLQTLLSIELPYVPISAYYHVACDGYAALEESTCVKIAIGVNDATEEDASTRRFYGYPLLPHTLVTGIHTERLYYLEPGAHTFYFLGAMLVSGDGVSINYHTITVVIYSDGVLTELPSTARSNIAPDGFPE